MLAMLPFTFLAMSFVINRRFYVAVLVMFAAGLLEASNLPHAFLVFALAWWLVLNERRRIAAATAGGSSRPDEERPPDAPIPAYSPMILTNTRLGRLPSNSP